MSSGNKYRKISKKRQSVESVEKCQSYDKY